MTSIGIPYHHAIGRPPPDGVVVRNSYRGQQPPTGPRPSKAWLAEKFPSGNWSIDSADVFATKSFAYADSWEALLSAWEDEVFTAMWPGMPLPFAGLAACLG